MACAKKHCVQEIQEFALMMDKMNNLFKQKHQMARKYMPLQNKLQELIKNPTIIAMVRCTLGRKHMPKQT